jgi:hypothetical protein
MMLLVQSPEMHYVEVSFAPPEIQRRNVSASRSRGLHRCDHLQLKPAKRETMRLEGKQF